MAKNAESGEQTAVSNEIAVQRASTFFETYTNSANIDSTAWDIGIIFGQIRKSGNTASIEQNVKVLMSPQHAKALATVLTNHIAEYEKAFGVISVPQNPPEPPPSAGVPIQ